MFAFYYCIHHKLTLCTHSSISHHLVHSFHMEITSFITGRSSRLDRRLAISPSTDCFSLLLAFFAIYDAFQKINDRQNEIKRRQAHTFTGQRTIFHKLNLLHANTHTHTLRKHNGSHSTHTSILAHAYWSKHHIIEPISISAVFFQRLRPANRPLYYWAALGSVAAESVTIITPFFLQMYTFEIATNTSRCLIISPMCTNVHTHARSFNKELIT